MNMKMESRSWVTRKRGPDRKIKRRKRIQRTIVEI